MQSRRVPRSARPAGPQLRLQACGAMYPKQGRLAWAFTAAASSRPCRLPLRKVSSSLRIVLPGGLACPRTCRAKRASWRLPAASCCRRSLRKASRCASRAAMSMLAAEPLNERSMAVTRGTCAKVQQNSIQTVHAGCLSHVCATSCAAISSNETNIYQHGPGSLLFSKSERSRGFLERHTREGHAHRGHSGDHST